MSHVMLRELFCDHTVDAQTSVMETRSRYILPDCIPTINYTKQHRITWDNVDSDSIVNECILSVLLHMFRNVYIHDENNVEPTPSILDIMCQVRQKTYMKIVNIVYFDKVDSEECAFFFQNKGEHGSVHCNTQTLGRNSCVIGVNAHLTSEPGTRILYVDAARIKDITTDSGASVRARGSTKTIKLYSYILDAMAATAELPADNTFGIAAVEVSMRNVQNTKVLRSVKYSRSCEEYTMINSDELVMKLYVEIQIRGKADLMANYLYGPSPAVHDGYALKVF